MMSDEELFEEIEIEPEVVNAEDGPIDDTDPEWNDYVIGLLTDDERVVAENGKVMPLCHGLRRIAKFLIGEVEGNVKQVLFPTGERHVCTVVYEIRIGEKTYTEVADVNPDNTDPFFLQFAPATASTRAEARALRKLLNLKTVAADELKTQDYNKVFGGGPQSDTTGEYSSEEAVSDQQWNYIDTLCQKADINALTFLLAQTGKPTKDINKGEIIEAIKLLNDYRGGRVEIPEAIKTYKENWR